MLRNGIALGVALLMILTALHFRASNTVAPAPQQYGVAVDRMQGTSMEQYGLIEGEFVTTILNGTCAPGDFCSFACLSEKCNILGTKPQNIFEVGLIKRLISVEDGCFWFEGNPDPWIENGQSVTSFDSRDFGCLRKGEFEITGTVLDTIP